ncbi:VanZ family protein [Proteiniborus sp. MB09-C3]|uniref:VanZ family protein n=1 Tax=Proteiniborus sp. MB09-C3 TaxID=3050072 RepID=UPI002554F724|nr:VanZ family protein [Proteiniborus sp. MB09-C3]WIV12107.1 VanZ family protein [Proteiniborus sp. MB09-C3]
MTECNGINLRKKLSWIAVIIWMALIFYLSHQSATKSNDLSTGITEKIIRTVERVAPDLELDLGNFNHITRKNAHFFAYLILGILVINTQRYGNVHGYRKIVLALTICVFYAISDEIHQLFISGRSGQFKDVLIDTVGAIFGIIVYSVSSKK